MTSTRRAKYLLKKRKHKSPSSVTSQLSSCNTNDSSIEEIPEDLVCTNCVETDYYLSKICEELFTSPSTAHHLLDELASNPLFPKGDLDMSCNAETGVPITTSLCVDCSSSDCDEPKKTKYYHDIDESSYTSEDFRTYSSGNNNNKSNNNNTPSHYLFNSISKISNNVGGGGNYEKERREIERQLIQKIYELVCVDHHQNTTTASSINDDNTTANRATKLYVSELAIKRMENIKKINYKNQLERIKRKLLDSYVAFSKFDDYLSNSNNNSAVSEINNIVPYQTKIKELQRSMRPYKY